MTLPITLWHYVSRMSVISRRLLVVPSKAAISASILPSLSALARPLLLLRPVRLDPSDVRRRLDVPLRPDRALRRDRSVGSRDMSLR